MTMIDNYRDMPIGMFQQIQRIQADSALEELDKQVEQLSLLTGESTDTLLNLPIVEYKALVARMAFLKHPLPEGKVMIAKRYPLGDFELIPTTDIRKVTASQYIDFQSFHAAGLDEHIAEVVSCILIPKGKIYSVDYDILDVQNAVFDEMSTYDALCLYAFFLASCKTSMLDILTFCKHLLRKAKGAKKEKLKKQIAMMETLLRSGGDGSAM